MRKTRFGLRSARQIKSALELIQPASKQRTMCKRDIVQALESVEFNKVMTGGAPAAHKSKFNQFAKKLRAIEALRCFAGPQYQIRDTPASALRPSASAMHSS